MGMPTPDNLTSVASVVTTLGINDTAENTLLAGLIPFVSALITESLGRTFLLANNAANPITEYQSGQGWQRLILRHRPVQGPQWTGNTTSGSAVVTGLSGTLGVFANASVSGLAVPSGTAVLSVQSSTQITLTNPATLTATATPILFGPAVWIDDNGYWGTYPGAFASTTQVFEGQDFALERDQPDLSSRRGMLLRIVGTWDTLYTSQAGQLSAHNATGQGNIKVQYTAGFASLPPDLELACIRVIAKCRNSKWYGDLVASESFDGQSYSLEQHRSQVGLGLLDGDVAPILARYRNFGMLGR